MPRLVKVRPTKIELIKLRRRLTLAKRIQKIVRDRLSILTMEFLRIAREIVDARQTLTDGMASAYAALSVAAGSHGYLALEKELAGAGRDIGIATGLRNVAGVRMPSFELVDPGKTIQTLNLLDTSSYLDQAASEWEATLRAIVRLAELGRSLDVMGMEINRTKRIVNALEYLVIPELKTTIKYLNMKFEERDREEKSRLKRVKVLLQQE
jgi:V/A-type H+/Na+-transporting ATPase subunit D